MKIEQLIWDSNFFGIKIGRVVIECESHFDFNILKEIAIKEKYELIYIVKYKLMFTLKSLVDINIELMDVMITMTRKLKKVDHKNLFIDLTNKLTDKELQDCYHIAESVSNVSRFYNEPKVGAEKTKLMYKKWIDNALNTSYSDGIFLEKESDLVTGIHLIKTDEKNKTGFFTLTGVHPNYKRRGIGKKLWENSFAYWVNKGGIEIIKSPFSFKNIDSFNFHINMGFNKIEEIKYIYHFIPCIR